MTELATQEHQPLNYTGTEDRALALLGTGISTEKVASALGVSAARISQLMADETFAGQVVALRYENLQKFNVRDGKYDSLEDRVLEKLESAIPLMFKPETILKALQTLNSAKRRGQSAPESAADKQQIVTLVLPKQITQNFTTNIDNQVVNAGGQNLQTMQSGNLLALAEKAETERAITHERSNSVSEERS